MMDEDEELIEGLAGLFTSIKTDHVEYADSCYELVYMHQLNNDPDVKDWWKSGDLIPYTFEGKEYEYNPDFHIIYTNGRNLVVEVTPAFLAGEPLIQAQAQAARRHYNQFRVDFQFVTENDIGLDFFRSFDYDGLIETSLALTSPEIIQRHKASLRYLATEPIYVPRGFKRLLARKNDFGEA